MVNFYIVNAIGQNLADYKKAWSKKSIPGCNLGPKFLPHAVHLSEKNDDMASEVWKNEFLWKQK